jgi:hypothetical protein
MNSCEFKVIFVAKDFEVEKGLLGLDRDCYLSIIKFLNSSILRKVRINIFFYLNFLKYISISEESYSRMKHIHFVIYRLKSINIIIICLLLFFSDSSLPLSRLIFPNTHGKFKLERRNIIFECGSRKRSLVLKKGISNGILKVFVLC